MFLTAWKYITFTMQRRSSVRDLVQDAVGFVINLLFKNIYTGSMVTMDTGSMVTMDTLCTVQQL